MRFTWHRRAIEVAGSLSLSALLGIATVGCKGSDTDVDDKQPDTPETSAPLTSVDPIAQSADFWAPLDASPSPDGDIIYFTAMAQDGPAVFSVTPGGQPTMLATSELLSSPFAVVPSFDGSTLYVADTGAEGDTEETGRIFSTPSSGGDMTELAAANGTMPKSMTLVQEDGRDVIYFTGVETTDQAPAVFKMNADGTGLEVIAAGDPLVDPSGIAVTSGGDIYVADSSGAGDSLAAVLKITNGTAEVFVTDIRVGFPAGIALDFDEKALFVSGLAKDDPSAVVYHVVLASGDITAINDGIAQNSESAGVHRAHRADVYAWANADGTASDPAGGTVYLLKGPKAP